MRNFDGGCNPSQMLKLCSVSPFDTPRKLDDLTTKIIACLAVEKDPLKLIDTIQILLEESCNVSLSRALARLRSVAEIDGELDFNRTGLDALSYSLDKRACELSIVTLQKVLEQFEEQVCTHNTPISKTCSLCDGPELDDKNRS